MKENSTLANISTVFIDLDDTIWWFTENSKVSLRHVYDSFGLSQWCPDYSLFVNVYMAKNKELWELYHHGKIEKDFLVTERFRYTLEQIAYTGDYDDMGARLNEEYLDFLARQTILVPGAKDLLEYLVGKGYDVNVLSNGFKNVQARKLQSGGVIHLINHLVLSDDCGITKPLPGIFDYALRVCSAHAETCVMIGDNYDADICGAHNAGWRTIFFNKCGTSTEELGLADYIVDGLPEIKNLL